MGGIPVAGTNGLSSSSPILVPSLSTVNTSASVSSTPVCNDDFHTQMLQLLNDTFSKLSTAITDTKNDTKSDWPKFSGKVSKFKDWYLAIMAQLSLPPWSSLYDPVKNDIVTSTVDSQLNGKLYAKLLVP